MDFQEISDNMQSEALQLDSHHGSNSLENGWEQPAGNARSGRTSDSESCSGNNSGYFSNRSTPPSTLRQPHHNTGSATSSASASRGSSPSQWRKKRIQEGFSLPLEEIRMACMQGNLAIVKALVKQGVAVDQILKSGWTALMYASSCGKPSAVEFLLQQGADPNLHKELFTALMAACASSHDSEKCLLECVNLLLDFGANADAAERHRMTPLMFASKEGRVSIVQRLVDVKVDINKQDNKGWTALCWAAAKGHGHVIRILLQNCADLFKVNCNGQRASDIALSAGYNQIADLLERLMKNPKASSEDSTLITSMPDKDVKNLNAESVTSYGELEMILIGLDLSSLIQVFQKHEITMEGFLQLKEQDLEKIGVAAVGARKKILKAIKEIHCKEWQTSSLPNLTLQSKITMPEAVAMVNNINKHIRYIHASMGYLRDQLESSPRLLQLGQEVHSVSSLSSHSAEAIKSISFLSNEMKFFKMYLDKV